MLADAGALAAIGLALGTVMAIVGSRWLRSFLYQLEPTDPIALLVSALVLLAVATLAAYLPARRAAHLDPMAALRHE